MKEKRKIRVGVIGAGMWGWQHLLAYSQHPGVEIKAVCDISAEKAEKAARQFEVRKWYTNIGEMLRERLDGISVVTPDSLHTDIVLEAVDKRIHVLVEKPLATTVSECEDMIQAADSAGVFLMVDWHNRWNPNMYYAKKVIENQELGKIRYVYYRLSDTIYVPTRMLSWAGQSSVLWFLGSHAIDTVCWLLQSKPTSVFSQKSALTLKERGIDTPDYFITMINFSNGAKAVVENSWILPQHSPALIDHKCEIVGDKGVIYMDPTHNRSFAKYTDQTGLGFPNESFPDMFISPTVQGKQVGFALESIYHFIDCIERGQAPSSSGNDGLLNTRVLRAAEKSAETNAMVQLG